MAKKIEKAFFSFYEEDKDPVVHQLAKLALVTFGTWVTTKLIETTYNAHFKLGDSAETEKEKDNDA